MTEPAPREEVLTTTCPRDCYDSCGITVIKRDGLVTAVRGDPHHPVSRGALVRQVLDGLQPGVA